MASRTISENINQAISDFKGIRQALIDKGAKIPQGTPTSEYDEIIDGMTVGGLDTSGITDFYNFCCRDRLNDQLDKLDTSNGTSFNGMFYQCYELTTIPQLDTSKGTSFSTMFSACRELTSVPQINTSNGTNFSSMFYQCYELTTIPQLDTSKGTSFSTMFYYCRKLLAVPQLDTSNGTSFEQMFFYCENLVEIPLLDTSKGTSFNQAFARCSKLTTIGLTSFIATSKMFEYSSNLQNLNVTGTITVKANDTLNLSTTNKLTVESLLSVLNALKDNTGGTTYNIKLGSTNLAKLTDEQKAIATNKNYTLS